MTQQTASPHPRHTRTPRSLYSTTEMTIPPPLPPHGPPPALDYATPAATGRSCPRCGQPAARPVKFTWWGGALGPRLFNHHKCHACRYQFNAKTGLPNTTAIVIYLLVGGVIGLIAGFLIFMMRI